jgi:hypothetical protein
MGEYFICENLLFPLAQGFVGGLTFDKSFI